MPRDLTEPTNASEVVAQASSARCSSCVHTPRAHIHPPTSPGGEGADEGVAAPMKLGRLCTRARGVCVCVCIFLLVCVSRLIGLPELTGYIRAHIFGPLSDYRGIIARSARRPTPDLLPSGLRVDERNQGFFYGGFVRFHLTC